MASRKYLLGILVLVLVFGVTVMGCDSDSGGGGEDYDLLLSYPWNFVGDDKFVGIILHIVTASGLPSAETQLNAFRAVTAADVTFTPNDIVSRTGFEHTEYDSMRIPQIKIPVTLLKAGEFEVTIRNKNGFSYKPIGYPGIFTVSEAQLLD